MLLATGCAVGPHYKSPKPDAVKFHAADANLVTEQPFNTRWWNQFEDPVLDSLVDRSLASNNGIRIARARLAESRSIFDERKLDRYPTVPVTLPISTARSRFPVSATSVEPSITLPPDSMRFGKLICSGVLVTESRHLAPTTRRSKPTFTMYKSA